MKVLLADDHPLILDGLHDLLVSNGIKVVGTARDGMEVVEKARTVHPDLILMDIQMPRLDGVAALRKIKAEQREVKVVILTVSAEDEHLFDAIKSGACGYLLKSQTAKELLALLGEAERGEVALSPGLAGRILREFGRQAGAASPPGRLSAREKEVLELVAQGLTYKEVAAKLFLSERTIKFHMGQILDRLHLKNRSDAVEYARTAGLAA